MSKFIKMTPEVETQCRADFEKALHGLKLADGKFTFTKVFDGGNRKAVIHYSSQAWEKQLRVLKEFDKEVAWHGVAYRDQNPESDVYYITDIMVYPQTVTSTTVEMDTEEYAKWLMANCDDERFDNIHMQAHSHVNMATSPSGVDLNHQEEILGMLGDDDFYIFMIWNKSLTKTNKIYDLKKNILFENADITVVVDGQEWLDDFLKEAKTMVKNKTYTPPAVTLASPAYPTYGVGTYGTGVRPTGSTYQQNPGPFNPMAGVTHPLAATQAAHKKEIPV